MMQCRVCKRGPLGDGVTLFRVNPLGEEAGIWECEECLTVAVEDDTMAGAPAQPQSPEPQPWWRLQIIVRPYPFREVPTRTHRRKRIAKKWLKRYGTMLEYLPVNEREILHDPQRGILYVYPRMEAEVRALLDAQRDT